MDKNKVEFNKITNIDADTFDGVLLYRIELRHTMLTSIDVWPLTMLLMVDNKVVVDLSRNNISHGTNILNRSVAYTLAKP